MEVAEVIDLKDSDSDEECDDDVDLTMEAVPFQEKVEKWLMNCGISAGNFGGDIGQVVREKTVVVKEVVDTCESIHSVDTEQYIKSNRQKTTTKITTTTIKKYYSMVHVAKNGHNNNENNYSDQQNQLLPNVPIDVASDEEKYSCKVTRRSPRKNSKNEPSVPEQFGKRRNRRNDDGCMQIDLNEVPSKDIKLSPISRKPYNTRVNDAVRSKIRICANLQKVKYKPKRVSISIKRLSESEPKVKTKSTNHRRARNLLSTKVAKAGTTKSKLKNRSLRNRKDLSSDSEVDDVLLSSFKHISSRYRKS